MLAYSILLFAAAALFFAAGLRMRKRGSRMIHDYHQTEVRQTEVRQTDEKAYGKAFERALYVIALSDAAAGTAALCGRPKTALAVSIAILGAGHLISLVMMGRAQKKYQGRLL